MNVPPEASLETVGPAIYVASPLGFSDPGVRYLHEVLHPALVAAGFSVLDPWSTGRELVANAGSDPDLYLLNRAMGAANAELIERAAAVFAVLDGTDVDSGTAAEIGFACARGRPVVGIRTDFRTAGDNAAAPVNLQVLHFVYASGGAFTTTLEEALAALHEIMRVRDSKRCIFHLAERSTWSAARRSGSYTSSTRDQGLAEVGFIHCSFDEQLLATAERFYGDADEGRFIVLAIDPDRLTSPLVVEVAGNGEGFPHIYGPLNATAVTATIELERRGGSFVLGRETPE